MTLEHTVSTIREANNLAIAASFRKGQPASIKATPCGIIWRGASIRVAISATRNDSHRMRSDRRGRDADSAEFQIDRPDLVALAGSEP